MCAVISEESGPTEEAAEIVHKFWLGWTSSKDVMSLVERVVRLTKSSWLGMMISKRNISSGELPGDQSSRERCCWW